MNEEKHALELTLSSQQNEVHAGKVEIAELKAIAIGKEKELETLGTPQHSHSHSHSHFIFCFQSLFFFFQLTLLLLLLLPLLLLLLLLISDAALTSEKVRNDTERQIMKEELSQLKAAYSDLNSKYHSTTSELAVKKEELLALGREHGKY